MRTPWFKTGDKILIAGVIIIIALILGRNYLGNGDETQLNAIITKDGQIIKQIELNGQKEPAYIYLDEGFHQVILVEKGRIRFIESDCPEQTCVKTGWLSQKGDKAVCVPARTVITIEGDHQRVDTLAY